MAQRTGTGLKRRALLVALAAGGLAARTVQAGTLPAPGSLASALALALRRRQPLVVMVSTEGCAWCKLVRDHYLAPLRRDQGLQAVQLDLGSRVGLVDFDGAASTHDELLRRWQVQVAPTLLFFGKGGREVAPRLVGVASDFYGAYLDQRLATARRSLP
ncbi:MAG: thioredoxin domain-containing protein [Ramlibacter sp.]